MQNKVSAVIKYDTLLLQIAALPHHGRLWHMPQECAADSKHNHRLLSRESYTLAYEAPGDTISNRYCTVTPGGSWRVLRYWAWAGDVRTCLRVRRRSCRVPSASLPPAVGWPAPGQRLSRRRAADAQNPPPPVSASPCRRRPAAKTHSLSMNLNL